MSSTLDVAAVEALTRARVDRGGPLSDEDLLRGLLRVEPDPRRLSLLSGVAKLLRTMDGLLDGKETGESFVAKFSDRFLALTEWDADAVLETAFEELNEFYSEIQMFSTSPASREEEPSLFGVERLKDRTQLAYVSLKNKWRLALEASQERALGP